jgi:hypothetical protein
VSIRIYADFNSRDELDRVDLGISRSRRELELLANQIHSGLPVVLFFDDVEVDAILEYDERDERWYGRVADWSAYRDV